MRDFDKSPYTHDEMRVAKWIVETGGIGGGDDPIGFLLNSYEMIKIEHTVLKRQLKNLVRALEDISLLLPNLNLILTQTQDFKPKE